MVDRANYLTNPLRQHFSIEGWKMHNTWLTKLGASDRTVFWKCEVSKKFGGWAQTIISRKVGLGGVIANTTTFIKVGKNIGQSNETTPTAQACKEAEARCNKKIKAGYTIEGSPGKQLPLKPMLAKLWADQRKKPSFEVGTYTWQPKLDGHRAIAYLRCTVTGDCHLQFYSREGTTLSIPHLEDLTMNYSRFMGQVCLDKSEIYIILDGELYCHGTKLQDITRLVRSGKPSKISYYIYDCCLMWAPAGGAHIPQVLDASYSRRKNIVTQVLRSMGYKEDYSRMTLEKFSKIQHTIGKHVGVWSLDVSSEAEGWAATDKAISLGFEGGMMKVNDGDYAPGRRSPKLLKMKRFIDEEFKIIDVTRGEDYKSGNMRAIPQALFQLEISQVIPDKDKDSIGIVFDTFEVSAPGTKKEKAEAWRKRKDYIGKICTVKHSGYTKKGIPVHAVALRIRDDL